MTAKEALALTRDFSDKETQDYLKNAYQRIKDAAIRGDFTVTYYKDIPIKVKNKLELDGYKVVETPPRSSEGNTITVISWFDESTEKPKNSESTDFNK